MSLFFVLPGSDCSMLWGIAAPRAEDNLCDGNCANDYLTVSIKLPGLYITGEI